MITEARRHLPHVSIEQGTGEHLPHADSSIDVAIATGIMHHVDDPSRVIAEMFRVSRKGILISDHNNYAFGGSMMQRIRMGLKMCGLLGGFTYVKQGFNKKGYSKEDGWWYPYSLLDNYGEIARKSTKVYMMPTRPATGSLGNFAFAQSHLCVVAFK
jgi:SAM-dependent methyltransferase